MQETKNERKYSLIVQMFGDHITRFEVPALYKRLNPNSEIMSSKEAEAKFKPYKDLLQDCYEKDPLETTEFLVRRGAVLLHNAYDIYKMHILERGLEEKDPKVVGDLLKGWKKTKRGIELGCRIIFNEFEPPSCLMPSKRVNYLQELENHLKELKEKSKKKTDSVKT